MTLAPQVIDYISIAAIMHLLNATSGKNRLGRQSANGLRTCVHALSSMSSKWKTRSFNSLKNIQDLARRWEVVWALPLQYTQTSPSKISSSTPEMFEYSAELGSREVSSVYKIFDDTTLDAAVQGLWDLSEVADQDWILDNAESIESNYVDVWNMNWQLYGGE